MKRRAPRPGRSTVRTVAAFAAAVLAIGLAAGCAGPGRQELAGAPDRAEAAVAAGPPPPELSVVHALAPGATYRVGEAVQSGDLIVALLEGRAVSDGVEARFLIRNAGSAEAVVSPGNFRLRTERGRPRMRLSPPPAPLPVGRLAPGATLRGSVSWDAPSDPDLRIVFANGPATVEWSLAG